MTVGILTRYSNNARDAWSYTLDTLGRYFERVGTTAAETKPEPLPDLERRDPPDAVVGMIGTYLESARLLGQRAGQLHLALGSDPDHPHFAPEPFTPFYQRALYQSMRNRAVQNLRLLTLSLDRLPPAVRPLAEKVARLESEIVARLRAVHEKRIDAKRIRCHGDFHLGQVLYTGKDFIIINYEGEPSRSVGERRLKRPPLRDVASMIRSFDYAVHVALARQFELGILREDRLAQVEPWVEYWHRWVSAVFLKAYLEVLRPSELLPRAPEQLGVLLEAHLLERALSELGYELHHNPARSKIPLRQILQLMEAKPVSA
jgi:maltose alpha-D-glucosyltransferase/alpha-amylase